MHIAIKIFLTSDTKDDERKKPMTFESFYETYKKDPLKFPYFPPLSLQPPRNSSK